MEILELHTQFEELVGEMQRLQGATALIDSNARGSEAVLAQGREVLEAATILLHQASETLSRGADVLGAEAASLQGLKSDVNSALAELQQASREQAGRVEASVSDVMNRQADARREVAELMQQTVAEAEGRSRERLDQVHQAVLQLTKAQRGLSAEVKSGFGAVTQKGAERSEEVRERLAKAVTESRQRLEQGVGRHLDQAESRLVEQGRTSVDGVRALRGEVEYLARRGAWALLAVLGLQVALFTYVVLAS